MAFVDRVQDLLLIPRWTPDERLSAQIADTHARDIHAIDGLLEAHGHPTGRNPALTEVLAATAGLRVQMGTPVKLKTIPHMGTVWDYRRFTHPNGGTIQPLVLVEHIPVIRQMDGRADLDVLWRVLVNQGLMVHNGTDGEGNVALYTQLNRLDYHARGANGLSCGTEHMHYSVNDDWSSRQLNAAAYLSYRAHRIEDIPMYRAVIGSGPGVVSVRRRGHTTHERVSDAAGYHDREDPGAKYEALMDEIRARAMHFRRYHKF